MPATKKAAPRKKAAPKKVEFGPSRYRLTVETGALELVGPDGQAWQPAACGDHRSVPVIERAVDQDPKKPVTAEGFQPDCEACTEQATSTASYAIAHNTV